jgi:hypothetical protein
VSGHRIIVILVAVALVGPVAALGTAGGSTTTTSAPSGNSCRSSTGPASSAATTPPSSGLIAVQQYTSAAPVFSDAAFNDASIAGVDLRINWNDVQTSPTTCD